MLRTFSFLLFAITSQLFAQPLTDIDAFYDAGPETKYIFGKSINALEKPDTTSKTLKTLRFGDAITVIKIDEEWYQGGECLESGGGFYFVPAKNVRSRYIMLANADVNKVFNEEIAMHKAIQHLERNEIPEARAMALRLIRLKEEPRKYVNRPIQTVLMVLDRPDLDRGDENFLTQAVKAYGDRPRAGELLSYGQYMLARTSARQGKWENSANLLVSCISSFTEVKAFYDAPPCEEGEGGVMLDRNMIRELLYALVVVKGPAWFRRKVELPLVGGEGAGNEATTEMVNRAMDLFRARAKEQ